MKKLVTLAILAVAICSCSHKTAPAKAVVAETRPVDQSVAINAALVAEGQKVYVGKCGKCHGLKEPANYTKERWVGLVDWMAPKANATPEEKARVLAYVQHNAKDAVK